MKEEMQRTCNRDGTTWYVPLDKRKTSKAKQIFYPRFLAKRHKGEILSYTRCPACGSTSFTERRVSI